MPPHDEQAVFAAMLPAAPPLFFIKQKLYQQRGRRLSAGRSRSVQYHGSFYYYNAKSVIFRIGMRRKQKLNQTADPSVMPSARAQLYDFVL